MISLIIHVVVALAILIGGFIGGYWLANHHKNELLDYLTDSDTPSV